MALKVDYVVKETGKNLVRNPFLTVANVLVVLVAIGLVGGALLVRVAVHHATERWRGGVEFIIFMNPDATQDQIDAVAQALANNPQVAPNGVQYLDHDAAYQEFLQLFPDSPELTEGMTPDALPTNFKVRPIRADSDLVESLATQFSQEPGVREVARATQAIRTIERGSNFISLLLFLLAVVLSVAALIFVGTTIQTAVFARRAEIEVMKLVGATNWFIRAPFMLEGVVQGVVGAVGGIALGVYGLNWLFTNHVARGEGIELLGNFAGSGADLLGIALLLFIGTIAVIAAASAVAVTFYVNV